MQLAFQNVHDPVFRHSGARIKQRFGRQIEATCRIRDLYDKEQIFGRRMPVRIGRRWRACYGDIRFWLIGFALFSWY